MIKKNNKIVFTKTEKKSILGLSCIFFFRMSGLFLILPVFSILAFDLEDATPALIGFALGAYGLTQAIFQIPFGVLSDRIGRKRVIAIGLGLFITGSILGALANNIYWMIAARLLQGSGAISAAVFALIADLTRNEVRTRANAILGAGVGLAFGVSFFFSPFLGSWMGLRGIFLTITVMAFLSLIILRWFVPSPQRISESIADATSPSMIKTVLGIYSLNSIYFGAFVCSIALSSMFFVAPLALKEYGFDNTDLWKIYIPMVVAGGAVMIPAAIIAEVKNSFRLVMLIGIVLLIASFLMSGIARNENSFILFIVSLMLFFMGFSIFEPIFPSLVTRITSPQTKGAASGFYHFSQFIGNFVGAVLAGLLYHQNPLILGSLLIFGASIFFYRTLFFTEPKSTNQIIT